MNLPRAKKQFLKGHGSAVTLTRSCSRAKKKIRKKNVPKK